MSDVAISVERLSKLYRLGLREETPDTLAGNLLSWLKAPAKNFKQLRSLTHFSPDDNSDDVLWALRDVSFEVKRGEVVGIVGRNGAGKSTLLKILSRITEPTSGRVVVNGRVGSLLEVGTGFHPELTGRENVYMNGTILGMSKVEIDRKFDEIVDFSGIEKFLDTPIKRYSSGMKVRLAFAVAAHLEPEILIIDEVLAVGDAVFQKKCLGKMETVAREGRTILFVSHQMEAVLNLCSRCFLLDNGGLAKEGESEAVVLDYMKRMVKQGQADGSIKREDRKGAGNFKFKKTWLEDKHGNVVNVFKSGDPVKIVAEYETSPDFIEGSVIISAPFSNLKNGLFTDISNRLTGNRIEIKSNQTGRIYCFVDRVPLNCGEYY